MYGTGFSAPVDPSNEWPKQDVFEEPTWLEIGSITVDVGAFNFEEVELDAVLWASHQAGVADVYTVSWATSGSS